MSSQTGEKVCGTWCSRGSATSTLHLTKSEAFRSEKLGTLTGDYEQVAVDLRETQERLQNEWEDWRPCHRRADFLEVTPGGGTRRARTLANVEHRLRAELRLHVETEELREELAQRRSFAKEISCSSSATGSLREMSSQLAELQTLFDEVNHQLHTECKCIEGVQETVNVCVKQSKELETIHHKLEESHQILTQMRDTRALVRGSGQ